MYVTRGKYGEISITNKLKKHISTNIPMQSQPGQLKGGVGVAVYDQVARNRNAYGTYILVHTSNVTLETISKTY